ncbi:cell division protein FtsZ [Methanosarcinales archaeon ex4572_44]|nr:MAG: cell division protein FtsZ [Methanosarcinales archaeon ex4484_138]PHP45227.1 MAG: cell division protein FtsZ [Methanosarcinales archaeon ex4572_44]RLG25898.1 MAG: cell division protein FtsZ [Methanosarcinales archaeon]
MESLLIEAMKHTEKDKIDIKQGNGEIEEFGTPRIIVVGCGGGGNNTTHRLHKIGVTGAETIAINTDRAHLQDRKADKRILIGKNNTKGLGAGGEPEVGRKAAEMGRETLEKILKDANLVFITAGMGGGTGTGSAPVIAQIAREQGAIVVGMVTTPFKVERARGIKAEEGIEELRKAADTVIVLDNERLLDFVPHLPIDQAFSVMDQLISVTVKGISETITQPSLVNLDYADVRTIMKGGGVAAMLVGEAKGQDKAKEVVRQALNHPLLDVEYGGATGCLIHITGGPDMSLNEAQEVAESLTYELDPHANVIFGARVLPEYEDKIQVLTIITGVTSPMILGPNTSTPQPQNPEQILDTQPYHGGGSIINNEPIIDIIR